MLLEPLQLVHFTSIKAKRKSKFHGCGTWDQWQTDDGNALLCQTLLAVPVVTFLVALTIVLKVPVSSQTQVIPLGCVLDLCVLPVCHLLHLAISD